jgi:Spy/CpxP family protein refolding chaperone
LSRLLRICSTGTASIEQFCFIRVEGDALMRVFRILLVIAIALFVTAPMVAQEKQAKKKGPAVKLSPAAQAMLRITMMHTAVKELDLTDEQEAKLKKLHEDNEPQMKEVFKKLSDLLTEEQKKAAGEAAKQAREDKKSDRQVMAAAQTAAKITDEQKEETDKIGQEMVKLQRGMMKKIMAVLTDEQKEEVKKAMTPQPRKRDGQKKKKKKADAPA